MNLKKTFSETIIKHKLIENNDKILIAFSGGKDSFVLYDLLFQLKNKAPIKFEILPVIINSYNSNYKKIENFFKKLNQEYIIKKTDFNTILKNTLGKQKNSGNYCFLCSRLRRGLLYKISKENNCNKIALGHNLDDAIETFLLNMFFVSKFQGIKIKYKSLKEIVVIRPLLFVPEKEILDYSNKKKFPILKIKCPLRKKDSKRELIKKFIKKLNKNDNFYPSMKNILKKFC
ncbi:MAG: ATP-binding protein [Candidatus Woesearchaeota archaeon]